MFLLQQLDYTAISWKRYSAREPKKSAIVNYSYEDDFIWIEFQAGKIYLYTEQAIGAGNFLAMKSLAEMGRGLSAFISQTEAIRVGFAAIYEKRGDRYLKV